MQAVQTAASAAYFSRLPGRNQRGDVVRVLTIIGPRLGLHSGALRALLSMIHMTRASDWTSGETVPICYREQAKVAAATGVTCRTTRNHEAVLERLGLIAKNVGANGSRGRFGRGEVIHGISFAPLIGRFADLLQLAEEIEEVTRQTEILRRRCSAARRSFNRALSALIEADPKNEALPSMLAIKADLPRRYEGMNLEDLQQLFGVVDDAGRDCWDLLSRATELSVTPEISVRPQIQITTEPDLESCSGSSATMRPARKRADHNACAAAPDGAADCNEEKDRMSDRGHKPGFTETFSPRQLYRMASDDMRMYLDEVCRDRDRLSGHDFVQAAIAILPAVGINHSAWDEALEAMGDMAAALSVLIIDANRHHPLNPIRSPGGALRAFARLAAAGRLNLHGSLIGLKQRMEARQSCSQGSATR